eukprot:11869048-Ditylum_brightwellii.AAC.1
MSLGDIGIAAGSLVVHTSRSDVGTANSDVVFSILMVLVVSVTGSSFQLGMSHQNWVVSPILILRYSAGSH